MTEINRVITACYQTEFSKLLATLLRIVGTDNFAQAEDIVHESFQRATEHWPQHGLPENPAAWLMLTAKRVAIDHLRQSSKREQLLQQEIEPTLQSEWTRTYSIEQAFSEAQLEDDQLRLMFWLCSTDIPAKQRLPLALKALCGLSVEAIARALLSKPETIKKRLSRIKHQLSGAEYTIPEEADLEAALDQVYPFLYLLFNEGISAHNPKPDSRSELCNTAMVYIGLLLEQPRFHQAETFALAALMHFHVARLPSRFEPNHTPINLVEQDRSLWLQPFLRKGMGLLKSALDLAQGVPSPYLLEALIAFEHCRAADFKQTDWAAISQHYNVLCEMKPSSLLRVNHAVAIAHTGDFGRANQVLESVEEAGLDHHVYATQAYIAGLQHTFDVAFSLADKAKAAGLPQKDFDALLRQLKQKELA